MSAGGANRGPLDRLRARWILRSADRAGPGARVVGRPLVRNMGRLEIGARLTISAIPIRSHLITWPGSLLTVGDDVTLSHGVAVAVQSRIEIGSRVLVGPFAMLMDTNFHHPGDWKDAKPRLHPVRIGDGAVIGAGAVILPGAVIGPGARIAPGSVVSGVVPAGSEVFGMPARPLAVPTPRNGTPAERVGRVFAEALELPSPPASDAPRRTIPGWSTTGGLRLLLALEAEFGVSLDDLAFMGASSPAEVIRIVDDALGRHATH